ncbi:MAG TPA: hypothetical protein DCP02_01950, partial [Actinobacteria bacterium]|nr:hypothetical protein [Actinomycetota bacterium]
KKIIRIKMSLPGYHNLYNGCLAAAICHHLGTGSGIIKQGIENAKMEEHRMNLIRCRRVTILDDCYNASPVSVKSAIDALLLISGKNNRRPVAILADMLELGRAAPDLHYEMGAYCAKKNIDVLITSGKLAKNICRGFEDEMKAGNGICFHFDDRYDLESGLKDIIKPEDIILVKGSRANKMEDIISYFQKKIMKTYDSAQ